MMRLSIELNVSGATLDEIISEAVSAWNKLSGEQATVLPTGSEIDVVPADKALGAAHYVARVFVRMKVEDNG